MTPSRLLSRNTCPSGPVPKRRFCAGRRLSSLGDDLFLNHLQERLRLAVVAEQHAPHRVLAPGGQIVGGDVEDLAARAVTEEQQIRKLRDRTVAVDDHAGGGGAALQQRVELAVLDHRVVEAGLSAGVDQADGPAAEEAEAPFPVVPAEVGAGGDQAHLLDDVLSDVGDEQVAVADVPREALRIADPVGVDLPERIGVAVAGEGIVGRDAVLSVGAVGTERVDAQDLAEDRRQVLGHVERIAAAPAVGGADVEQAEVRIAGGGERIEAELPAVVVAERLLHPQQLARRPAVVGRRGGVPGRPLQQDGVLRVAPAPRHEVRGWGGVAGVGIGVELAVSGRARLAELRVQGEALEAALAPRSFPHRAPSEARAGRGTR